MLTAVVGGNIQCIVVTPLIIVGEELCYQLSRLGARLILTARSEDKLKVVRKGLAKPNQAKYVRYRIAGYFRGANISLS